MFKFKFTECLDCLPFVSSPESTFWVGLGREIIMVPTPKTSHNVTVSFQPNWLSSLAVKLTVFKHLLANYANSSLDLWLEVVSPSVIFDPRNFHIATSLLLTTMYILYANKIIFGIIFGAQ